MEPRVGRWALRAVLGPSVTAQSLGGFWCGPPLRNSSNIPRPPGHGAWHPFGPSGAHLPPQGHFHWRECPRGQLKRQSRTWGKPIFSSLNIRPRPFRTQPTWGQGTRLLSPAQQKVSSSPSFHALDGQPWRRPGCSQPWFDSNLPSRHARSQPAPALVDVPRQEGLQSNLCHRGFL